MYCPSTGAAGSVIVYAVIVVAGLNRVFTYPAAIVLEVPVVIVFHPEKANPFLTCV